MSEFSPDGIIRMEPMMSPSGVTFLRPVSPLQPGRVLFNKSVRQTPLQRILEAGIQAVQVASGERTCAERIGLPIKFKHIAQILNGAVA